MQTAHPARPGLTIWLACVCMLSVRAETELSDTEELAAPFGYYDAPEEIRPDKWKDKYPICGLQRQSPIGISQTDAVYFHAFGFETNVFRFHYHEDAIGWMANNGHTVEFVVQDGPLNRLKVTGGLLDSPYDLVQFHWHWGSTDGQGSEHTLDGRQYAAELHFVHLNERYDGQLSEIKTNKDGVAVLGVLVEIGDEAHEGVEEFLQHMEQTNLPELQGNRTVVKLPRLRSLLPANTDRFYRYLGSLTTPPCYEVVIWTVFEDTLKMSRDQINRFRQILHSSHESAEKTDAGNTTPKNATRRLLVDNFRPLQPINGRVIFSSFPTGPSELIETTDLRLHNWDYHLEKDHGPLRWDETFAACAGERQSPIHVQHDQAVHSPEISASPWRLTNYDTLPEGASVVLENNGHTAVVLVGEGVTVSGGGLPSEYRLIQLHWHWGSHNDNGSEHLLDGKQYPAELHLVHSNMYYGSNVNQIEGNHDGMAVLAVFIEVGDHNSAMDPILSQFDEVKYTSDTKMVKLKMTSLRHLLPDDMSQFYRYYGSLTTPPCNEIVIWTVFRKPITMSQVQLDYFRSKIYDGPSPTVSESDIVVGGYVSKDDAHAQRLVNNFRPTQPLHDRLVYFGKIDESKRPRFGSPPQGGAASGTATRACSMGALWLVLACYWRL